MRIAILKHRSLGCLVCGGLLLVSAVSKAQELNQANVETRSGHATVQSIPPGAPAVLKGPRPLLEVEELGRAPLSNYGSLEPIIQNLRAHRPLDLNSKQWRAEHPQGDYEDWAQQARSVLAHGLHYDPGQLDLQATTTEKWSR